MLKTSALIAGIAGAGLGLMIGSAAPASAAEIGVRHSHGTSTRNITHGRFMAETKVREAYAEASAGWTLGGAESSSLSTDGEFVQSELPRVSTGYQNNDSGSIEGPRNIRGEYENDRSGYDVRRPTEFVGTTTEESAWQLGGSGYVRGLVGLRSTDIKEGYRFSGTDTNSFSELSTFSR